MSYTRHFKKTIDVPVRISIRDPRIGENYSSSGSVDLEVGDYHRSYSIDALGGHQRDSFTNHEVVHVNIEVDTEEYDDQIDNCVDNVQLLTGSVVATEAAQVKSVRDNSRKVAKTIVKGFFKNIEAELSSQIMELSKKVDSKFGHLNEQAKDLLKKKAQMQQDYQRTATRYTKIFEDLNHELENRVVALDQPIYKFHESVQHESDRMLDGDFVNTSSVVNAENSVLESQIMGAIIKKRTQEAIAKTRKLLMIQRRTNRIINRTLMSNDKDECQYYLPVLFYENTVGYGMTSKQCVYDSQMIPGTVNDTIANAYLAPNSSDFIFDEKQQEAILPYLSNEVNLAYSNKNSSHDERVKDMIFKLLKK